MRLGIHSAGPIKPGGVTVQLCRPDWADAKGDIYRSYSVIRPDSYGGIEDIQFVDVCVRGGHGHKLTDTQVRAKAKKAARRPVSCS